MNEQTNLMLFGQDIGFVAIFVVMLAVITVLSAIVILQNRKANSLKPRYGFLGKPLALSFLAILAFGSTALLYYSNQNPQNITNVSANKDIKLKIQSVKLGQNSYTFNIIPSLNNIEWGVDGEFDVYWTISNSSSETRIEYKLTNTDRGGITLDLRAGTNKIRAVVFSESYSSEVTKEIVL